MPGTKRLLLIALVIFCAVFVVWPVTMLNAQNDSIVLSIAVPEYMSDTFRPELFKDFEAANPGIAVHIIKSGQDMYFGQAAWGLEDHLKGVEKYARSADVLYVDSYNLAPQGVRAGYILNLAPLTQGDDTLHPDDFLPAAWKSVQWDNGVWALPASVDFQVFTYDKAAFDQAGAPYPNEKWTLDDLASALRLISPVGSDGKAKSPGLIVFNPDLMANVFTGEKFFDDSTVPAVPQLNKPKLVAFLAQWAKLQDEGLISAGGSNVDYNTVPMRVDGAYALSSNMGPDQKVRTGALLPGGKAGLTIQGFAISGGTQYPNQAYALLKFLTSSAKIATRFYGNRPARTSLVGVKGDNQMFMPPTLSPEAQALADKAFANAIPVSDLRFGDYISLAVSRLADYQGDAKAALTTFETSAIRDLKLVDEHRNATALVVSTPVPTPVLSTGQVSIRFHLQANVSPLPNKDAWDRAIKDFTGADPEVKQVEFDTAFLTGNDKITDKYDCFFTDYNGVQTASLADYLPLDPLLSADSAFDKTDVFNGVLDQLRRDDKTWGYPVTLEPQVLFYDADAFTKANIPLPKPDWTMADFNDALKALKGSPDDPAPFTSQQFGSDTILMLVAGYGGLPFDPRTDPATINYTDPGNVEAIRQALDLAKKGYLKYQELTGTGGYVSSMGNTPLYSDMLTAISYRFFAPSASVEYKNPYKLVGYPRGSKFNVASFNVGAAYISAKAPNPQACYRWIQYIANRVELFQSMPARRSLLRDPALAASQGSDVTAIYDDIGTLIQDPKTVALPGIFNGTSISNYFSQFWLNRAFDHYVLKDADLVTELTDAENNAKAFQECVGKIPPSTASTEEEMVAYYKQYMDCAIKIDPSLKSRFQPSQ